MKKLKSLDYYLVLNSNSLDAEVVAKIKESAQRFNKFFILTKKAFVLFFWQQYNQQLMSLEEFMYVWDFSKDNSEVWEIGRKLEWMYFLWGLVLQDTIDFKTGYVVDNLSLKLFQSKHSSLYEKLIQYLDLKESQIIAI